MSGCDRMFDDPRYLESDHNTLRSDSGINPMSIGCCYVVHVID